MPARPTPNFFSPTRRVSHWCIDLVSSSDLLLIIFPFRLGCFVFSRLARLCAELARGTQIAKFPVPIDLGSIDEPSDPGWIYQESAFPSRFVAFAAPIEVS